jgi:hypothetical protein
MATGLKSGKTYAGEENRATSRASPAHGWMNDTGGDPTLGPRSKRSRLDPLVCFVRPRKFLPTVSSFLLSARVVTPL